MPVFSMTWWVLPIVLRFLGKGCARANDLPLCADTLLLRAWIFRMSKNGGGRPRDGSFRGAKTEGLLRYMEKGLTAWRQTGPYNFIIADCQWVLRVWGL